MSRLQTFGAAVLILLLDAPRPVTAQQKFTSSTSLLTLDVTVVDRDGNPITGLTPDDFAVTLNGKKQSTRAVSYLGNVQTGTSEVSAKVPAVKPAPSPFASVDPENALDPRLF